MKIYLLEYLYLHFRLLEYICQLLFCNLYILYKILIKFMCIFHNQKKSFACETLRLRRVAGKRHLPIRRSAILAERFLLYGKRVVSYKVKTVSVHSEHCTETLFLRYRCVKNFHTEINVSMSFSSLRGSLHQNALSLSLSSRSPGSKSSSSFPSHTA